MVLVSCQVKKQTTSHTFEQSTKDKDSIIYIVKDIVTIDTHWISPDTARIMARISDSLGSIYITKIQEIRGQYVRPLIRIKHDTIELTCIVDSMAIFSIYKEKYIKEYQFQSQDKQTTTKDESRTVINRSLKTMLWIAIALAAGFLIIRIIRKFLF